MGTCIILTMNSIKKKKKKTFFLLVADWPQIRSGIGSMVAFEPKNVPRRGKKKKGEKTEYNR